MRRIMLGMSQEKLGDALQLTFQQVQKYESGANRISMGRLTRIARVLGVTVPYLLAGSRQAAVRANSRDEAKLAQATRMLGGIGALRLLKAFLALPTHPPRLRESILNLVEGTAVAVQLRTLGRNGSRRRSKKGSQRKR